MKKQIEVKNIELAPKYGFIKFDQELRDYYGYGFYTVDFALDLGESRKGQSYYLLIEEDKKMSFFATEPDGAPGSIPFTEELLQLLFQMRQDGFI